MSSVYEEMAAGRPAEQVIRALASTNDEELEREAPHVTNDQFPWVMSFSEKIVRATGIQRVLFSGAVLHAGSFLGTLPYRREMVDRMCEDLGLSRSERSRCVQIWLAFGRQLITEQKLQKHFCEASLAILSQTQTSPAAREEALQVAREGEKISMQRAREVQLKHASDRASTEGEVARRNKSKLKSDGSTNKWLFIGAAVRIEAKPAKAKQIPDKHAVICDFEAAIAELRNSSSNLVA